MVNHMHIVVIGGSGFLGNSLINYLSRQGRYPIINIDVKRPCHGSAAEYIRCRLSSQREVDGIFSRIRHRHKGGVTVFHFAGMGNKELCERVPDKAVFSNVVLTGYLLAACEKYNFNKFVFPSSGYVYAQKNGLPISENDRLEASSVYSAAKIAGERVVKGVSPISSVKCFILRMSNVYGPGNSQDNVFGSVIKQSLKRSKEILLLRLDPRRDFIYIDDLSRCFQGIIESSCGGKINIFNISSNRSYPVSEIAVKIFNEMSLPGRSVKAVTAGKDRTDIVLSNKKIRLATGWRPEYTLADGIKDYVSKLRGLQI